MITETLWFLVCHIFFPLLPTLLPADYVLEVSEITGQVFCRVQGIPFQSSRQ